MRLAGWHGLSKAVTSIPLARATGIVDIDMWKAGADVCAAQRVRSGRKQPRRFSTRVVSSLPLAVRACKGDRSGALPESLRGLKRAGCSLKTVRILWAERQSKEQQKMFVAPFRRGDDGHEAEGAHGVWVFNRPNRATLGPQGKIIGPDP